MTEMNFSIPGKNSEDLVVVLRSSANRWSGMLIAMVFAGLVCWYFLIRGDPEDAWKLWLGLILALALVPYIAYQMLAGKLILDEEGFTAKTLFRKNRYRWTDISGYFIAGKEGRSERITFTPAGKMSLYGKLHKMVYGDSHRLPDTYGLPASELAVMLNDRLRKHRDPPDDGDGPMY